jgi:hypothetical protein
MQDFGLNSQPRLANPSSLVIYSLQPLQIKLVILFLIDPPLPAFPIFPTITIQLWRSFPLYPLDTRSRQREARTVWEADWTETPTPFYILLSDIFRGPPPAAYGHHDRIFLDTRAWRDGIISRYV